MGTWEAYYLNFQGSVCIWDGGHEMISLENKSNQI